MRLKANEKGWVVLSFSEKWLRHLTERKNFSYNLLERNLQ